MSIDAYTTAGLNLQFPSPIPSTRDPTSNDIIAPSGSPYLAGQLWINTNANKQWVYTGGGTWVLTGSGSSGAINSITGDTGGAEVPSAGNFNLLGTANQVVVTGTTNTQTFSLASSPSVSGTVTAGTGFTATNGNLTLSGAGNKINIHATTAASDSVGTTSAMSGTPGAVTVTSSAVTASSKIFYSRATTGGTPGNVSITAQAGGSFTLTSTANETSTFNYLIIN